MAETFRIARSTTLAAPPERIAPHIEDLRAWEKWSPYEKLDPQMKKTFSGAERGAGASYAWDGSSTYVHRPPFSRASARRPRR